MNSIKHMLRHWLLTKDKDFLNEIDHKEPDKLMRVYISDELEEVINDISTKE